MLHSALRKRPVYDPITLGLFAGGENGLVYNPSVLSSLTTDSAGTAPVTAYGDAVGRMADLSPNARHALQATGANRMIYGTDGIRGWVEGNGTDQWMRATFTLNQPWERISVIRQLSFTLGDNVFGGGSANSGALFQTLNGGSGVPYLRAFSSAGASASLFLSDANIGDDAVVFEGHYGATGALQINNGRVISLASGTTASGGQTICANSSGAAIAHARVYFCMIREGTMTAAQRLEVQRYAASLVRVPF